MQEKIIVKKANKSDLKEEITSIGFDLQYIDSAIGKYKNETYKIFSLFPHEANILKQLCLSLGFDCAVSRNTVTCRCEHTNAVINSTISQLKRLIVKLKMQPFRLPELAQKLEYSQFEKLEPLTIRNKELNWNRPYIMGILNVTPDSFSDGGEYFSPEAATSKALSLIEDGADIIDIGGESTRPGATEVSPEEETNRVVPVIENIRKLNPKILISIDTRNFKTAKSAIEAGADIINDVSGLNNDKELLEFVAKENLPIIIMHSTKVPAISSQIDSTHTLIDSIYKCLDEKIELLSSLGVSKNKIIIDPGIGFGKSINDNFEIIKRIDEFQSLKVPILMGISRKSFISSSFEVSKEELDTATLTYNSFLMTKNVNIIRVHDVKKHKKHLNYLSKVL